LQGDHISETKYLHCAVVEVYLGSLNSWVTLIVRWLYYRDEDREMGFDCCC